MESKLTKGPLNFYLMLSAFFGDIIITMMIVSLPLYALSLGATPLEIGIMGGSSALIYSILPYFTGRFALKMGLLKMIAIAQFLNSLSTLSYSLTNSPIILILLRLLEGLSWSLLWPATEVLASLLYKDPEKGLRYYNLAWSLGALMGPIIAGSLITYVSIKASFYLCSISSILLGALGFLLSKERGLEFYKEELPKFSLGEIIKVKILLIPFVSSLIISLVLTFFPPYASKFGLIALEIGLIIFLSGLMRTLAFLLAPLYKRFDSEKILVFAGTLATLSPLPLLIQEKIFFYLSLSLLGFIGGTIYSTALSKMVGEVEPTLRGSRAGMFEGTLGLGFFIGPIIGGLVAEFELRYTFLLPIFFFFIPLLTYVGRIKVHK
ncbi:MAG: MFS transporter [Nitrososphaerales archaeon]